MVPVGTILPIPDAENPDMGVQGQRIKPAEARNWRDRRLVTIFDENDGLFGMAAYRGEICPPKHLYLALKIPSQQHRH